MDEEQWAMMDTVITTFYTLFGIERWELFLITGNTLAGGGIALLFQLPLALVIFLASYGFMAAWLTGVILRLTTLVST